MLLGEREKDRGREMERGREGRRHEPTGQTKCLLADECEKSECPLIAESSVSQIAPTASRRPLTSHFAVRDGFPSYLGVDFFQGEGECGKCLRRRPLVCRVIVASASVTECFFIFLTFFFAAGAGAAGRWRVPEIN